MLFVITIFLAAIGVLAILAITWLIRRSGNKSLSRALRKYLLIALGALFLGFHIYDWWSRRHYYEFNLGNNYIVELKLIEYDSFLDYPVDLEFELEDHDTGDKFSFEISSGEGPYFELLISENQPDLILIRGTWQNKGVFYWVDMANKTLEGQGKEDDPNLQVMAEFAPGLRLITY